MRLANKIAIITGAGDGIGRTTALLFAKEGATVVATDINEEKGSLTAQEIQENGGEAMFVRHDIREERDWHEVVKRTTNAYGTIDVLFNNAGVFLIKPLIETTIEEWNHVMSVNVAGTFLGLKHVIPVMMKNKKGSIINNSSTAGLVGSLGVSLYGTSKGAIRTLTKHAAMEYANHHIRVNAIFPGFVNTQMISYRQDQDQMSSEEQSKGVPLGRIGDTEDISRTVLFLASDESAYTTGSEFVIDGGRSAGKSY